MVVLARRFPERTEENHEKNLINSNSYLPNTSPDHYLYTNPFDSSPSSSSPIRIIRLTFCLYISFQDSLTPKPTPFSSHQCRVSPLLMVSRDVWRERKSKRHATPPETPTDSLPELWRVVSCWPGAGSDGLREGERSAAAWCSLRAAIG